MPNTSDVIVVGGGVIGTAIAYGLAKEKLKVTLVEQRDLCSGATYASAGMVAPLSDSPVGHPSLDLGVRSYRMYDSWIKEIEEAGGFYVDYLRSGILRVALTEDEERELKALSGRAAEIGVNAQWLDPKEARAGRGRQKDGCWNDQV